VSKISFVLFLISVTGASDMNDGYTGNTGNTVPVLTTSNFLELRHPGVYTIYNKTKNMYYHGEIRSLLQRFEKHFCALEQKTHDNRPLQEDYSRDPSYFEFLVSYWGPDWD